MYGNIVGSGNSAFGWSALQSNLADENTAIGSHALFTNTTGEGNAATGAWALSSNTQGDFNTANGAFALSGNTTGERNTATGNSALFSNTTGSDNIALGDGAGFGITTANNMICIGTNVPANDSNSCYIGQIFGNTVPGGGTVFITSSGKLGTSTSSRQFKEKIKPMEQASELLFALKPVTFRYKKELDPAGTFQFRLVAEDVANVNPDLVVRDKEGKPYSVRYDQVNAMLLNEFLTEHRKVQEQQEEIETLKAELKEQRHLIQKVSDRVEMAKPEGLVTKNP